MYIHTTTTTATTTTNNNNHNNNNDNDDRQLRAAGLREGQHGRDRGVWVVAAAAGRLDMRNNRPL